MHLDDRTVPDENRDSAQAAAAGHEKQACQGASPPFPDQPAGSISACSTPHLCHQLHCTWACHLTGNSGTGPRNPLPALRLLLAAWAANSPSTGCDDITLLALGARHTEDHELSRLPVQLILRATPGQRGGLRRRAPARKEGAWGGRTPLQNWESLPPATKTRFLSARWGLWWKRSYVLG